MQAGSCWPATLSAEEWRRGASMEAAAVNQHESSHTPPSRRKTTHYCRIGWQRAAAVAAVLLLASLPAFAAAQGVPSRSVLDICLKHRPLALLLGLTPLQTRNHHAADAGPSARCASCTQHAFGHRRVARCARCCWLLCLTAVPLANHRVALTPSRSEEAAPTAETHSGRRRLCLCAACNRRDQHFALAESHTVQPLRHP